MYIDTKTPGPFEPGVLVSFEQSYIVYHFSMNAMH
jgi:hypothetical protein